MTRAFEARWRSFAFLSCTVAALLASTTASADGSGSGIDPDYYEGNPTCADLGYAHGFKIEAEELVDGSGTFDLPGGYNSVSVDSDGTYVDWWSTLGIDAVIVKGGPNANVYVYDPEAYEDAGLASPINKDTPYGLSHIDFCYDYEVKVEKDACGEYTRKWDWTIDKSSDKTDLTLSDGQTYDMVQYEVSVYGDYEDCDWSVSGTIWITNPDPEYDADIAGVKDEMDGDIWAEVDCGCEFPYVLAPGETLECKYRADLPDGEHRENKAWAEMCDWSKVGGGYGKADVVWEEEPTKELDECIKVEDDQYGYLGEACEDTTFEYCLDIGPYDECGDYEFVNTASYESCDSGNYGSDDHTVNVHVPCGCACTLTQGYWKTHSEYGPAPYDDAWALLPEGADTEFFHSGLSWYEVFWTAPAGDFYFNLAHQYMAAELNLLNGSMAPASVQTALANAEALFEAQGDGDTTLTTMEKRKATRWTTTLTKYNEGAIGPGHCDE